MSQPDATPQNAPLVQTIDIGYVHVLDAPGGVCTATCPHPDHDDPADRWTFASLARVDWVQDDIRVKLHALASLDNPAQAEEDWGGPGTTACGIHSKWLMIPGLFSRMGRRRCAQCCDALGYPRGTGSPKNDDRCRALLGLEPSDA